MNIERKLGHLQLNSCILWKQIEGFLILKMDFLCDEKSGHLKVTVMEVGQQLELLWRREEHAYLGSQP